MDLELVAAGIPGAVDHLWEGLRFIRSPQPRAESLLAHRFEGCFFHVIFRYLTVAEARRITPASPYLALNVHYLGRWHIYSCIDSSYRPPQRSRALRWARHFVWEEEQFWAQAAGASVESLW